MKSILATWILCIAAAISASAQKLDEERMKRDIEVAENVLGPLIRQQFANQRNFFPLEVRGSYQSGYGVTFMLPADFTMPIVFTFSGGPNDNVFINEGNSVNGSYSFEYYSDEDERQDNADRLRDRAKEKKRMDLDSIRNAYNVKLVDAAKTFIADYADMITQLRTEERIVITNQGSQPRTYVGVLFKNPKRTHLAIEASRADVAAFRQGKLTRDQMMAK